MLLLDLYRILFMLFLALLILIVLIPIMMFIILLDTGYLIGMWGKAVWQSLKSTMK